MKTANVLKKLGLYKPLVGLHFKLKILEFLKIYRSNRRPDMVSIAITGKCNSKCIFCEVPEQVVGKEELSEKRLLKLVDEMADAGVKKVHLVGGEPFLRKNIFEIIQKLHAKRMGIYITTNALIIPDFREQHLKIIKDCVSTMVFSLDSTNKKQYDGIRGIPGAYDKVINAIKKIKALEGPYTIISCVVMRQNLDEIPKLVKLAHELGIDYVTFQPVSPITVFENTKAKKGKENLLLKTKSDIEKLEAKLQEGIALSRKLGIETSLKYFRLIAKPYFESFMTKSDKPYLEGIVKRVKCISALRGPFIDYEGSFKPCLVLPAIGNINRSSLADLWKSEEPFREALKNGNLPKACGYCFCNPGENIRFSMFMDKFRK